MKEVYYTIEKLPYRKSWSLNRVVKGGGSFLEPVAYFTSEQKARLTLEELADEK